MQDIEPPRAERCEFYIDRLHVWVAEPLRDSRLIELAEQCQGPLHITRKPRRFNSHLRQRLDLVRPSRAGLELISSINEATANYCEFACDMIFGDESTADRFLDFVCEHLVTARHRASMNARRFDNRSSARTKSKRPGPGFQTRSIARGQRRVGCCIKGYADRSRITGETACAHLEIRYSSERSLSRIGIERPHDLVDYDVRTHFARYFTLKKLDREALGRFHSNHLSGSRRKTPDITRRGKFSYNRDAAIGGALYRFYGAYDEGYHSLQRFLDTYPLRRASRRFLAPIPLMLP